jgi:hypothetical protein
LKFELTVVLNQTNMKKLSSLIFVLFVQLANGQTIFQKTYGGTLHDYEQCAKQTTDGGYIIVGYTKNFGAGNSDFYLVKTNSQGDSLWTKTYGGVNEDRAYSFEQTTDGGYIVAGYTFASGNDLNLVKTDNLGNLLWAKTYIGIFIDGTSAVQQTADGGYVITGSSCINNDCYITLIKTDANGDSLWIKGYSEGEHGNSVRQTTDGGYIITGTTEDFGAGITDIYLIKADSNGNLLWSRTFGGNEEDRGYSVQQTNDGGYIVAGLIVNAGYYTACLIKTDDNGDSLWTKTFYGGAAFSIQQTANGGYIVVFGYNAYLMKTDANGNPIWTQTFTNGDINSVQQTSDGGFIVGGYTNNFGAGLVDFYLIKTDSNGISGCNQANYTPMESSMLMQISSPATVTVSIPTIVTNSSFTVSNGGDITTPCISVGINKTASNNLFFISPNPSTGDFIISFDRAIMNGNVEILNILGENIFSENTFNESKKEINLKNISSGIYFVKVFDGEKSYCKKLIIEN